MTGYEAKIDCPNYQPIDTKYGSGTSIPLVALIAQHDAIRAGIMVLTKMLDEAELLDPGYTWNASIATEGEKVVVRLMPEAVKR